MRIHIMACRVLTRELSRLIYDCQNAVDVTWLPQGLHDTPTVLHNSIVEELDRLEHLMERRLIRKKPDYIVMGYGLCSKATVGLEAKSIPLVIPRTEDCIALFLGSQERYLQYFKEYPGTYWMNSQWIQDIPHADPDYMEQLRETYMEEYEDEETVEYLLETEKSSLAAYNRVGYIRTDTFDDSNQRKLAEDMAGRFDLQYKEFTGENRMLRKIVAGEFDEKDFLIVPPGYRTEYSNGSERIRAVECE